MGYGTTKSVGFDFLNIGFLLFIRNNRRTIHDLCIRIGYRPIPDRENVIARLLGNSVYRFARSNFRWR